MRTFELFAYLSPMVLGLVLPFLMALKGRPWLRMGVAFGGVVVVLVVLALFDDDPVAEALAVSGYLLGFSVFVVGWARGLRAIGLTPVGAQIGTSLVVVALIASLFCSDPFLEASEKPQETAAWFRRLEPMIAIGDALGGEDPTHYDQMYSISRVGDYAPVPVRWTWAALWLGGIGAGLLALCAAGRLIRMRDGAGKVQPAGPVRPDRGGGTEEASG